MLAKWRIRRIVNQMLQQNSDTIRLHECTLSWCDRDHWTVWVGDPESEEMQVLIQFDLYRRDGEYRLKQSSFLGTCPNRSEVRKRHTSLTPTSHTNRLMPLPGDLLQLEQRLAFFLLSPEGLQCKLHRFARDTVALRKIGARQ